MARLSGQEMFDKYKKNMVNATSDIKRGIETTTKSQSENAIAAIPQMKENLVKAIDNGRVEAGLRKSGDAKWKRNTIEKGLPKIAAGIEANKPEIIETMAKVSAIGEEIKKQVATMPKGDIDTMLNRVRANMQMQKAAWGKD